MSLASGRWDLSLERFFQRVLSSRRERIESGHVDAGEGGKEEEDKNRTPGSEKAAAIAYDAKTANAARIRYAEAIRFASLIDVSHLSLSLSLSLSSSLFSFLSLSPTHAHDVVTPV